MKNRVTKVGLVKIKRKAGNYYRIRYRLPSNNNYTYENIGYVSKYDAELARSQRQMDLVNGKYNLYTQDKEIISLERLISEFYSSRPDLHSTTLKKYKSYTGRLKSFIAENFRNADNDISNLKSIYVIELLTRSIKNNLWSTKNCNGARALFQMILDYAVRKHYMDENPIKEIKPFTIPEKTTGKVITNDDLKKIFNALPQHWIDPIKFLLNTGLRNAELTNLTWDNFHSTKKGNKLINYIEVTSSDEFLTKTRKSRKIPLNSEALAIIKRKKGIHPKYIFTTSFKEKISHHRLSKVLKNAQKKLKSNYRIHDFRHTFGSKLAMNNISLYKISELLGHSIQETTKLYAHLQSEDLKEAVDSIKY